MGPRRSHTRGFQDQEFPLYRSQREDSGRLREAPSPPTIHTQDVGKGLQATGPGPLPHTDPTPTDLGSALCFAGLQPPLVSRVWELLLHYGDVLTRQLQLQVLQDRGPGPAK